MTVRFPHRFARPVDFTNKFIHSLSLIAFAAQKGDNCRFSTGRSTNEPEPDANARSRVPADRIAHIHMPIPLTVFKLGGSLLDHPGLAQLLRGLVQQRPGSAVVVGGGGAADLVRGWAKTHQFGDEPAHWLALEAMAFNEALLRELVPELRLVRNVKQWTAVAAEGHPALVCCSCFVRWAEAANYPPLPRTWDVTSDSLAAWIASVAQAQELVLLKSVPTPTGLTAQEASRAGLVDVAFPTLHGSVRCISWVNGQLPPSTIEPWLTVARCPQNIADDSGVINTR